MKRTRLLKAMILLMILLSFSAVNKVEAANKQTLSTGTYKVGKDLSAGLIKFTLSKGEALIYLTKNGANETLYEELSDDKEYGPNHFTARLNDGDKIEVSLYEDSAPLTVQKLAKIDANKVEAGYYEIGADIPVGTYNLQIDRPYDEYDTAYISIFDSKYHEKEAFDFYQESGSFAYKFSKGDKIYIASLTGTMSFKEKILIPQSITLSKSHLSLMVNKTAKITATVNPSTVTNKNVSWSSSNPTVATVDASGNIKARKAGNTTITATAKGNMSVTKSVKLTVNNIVPTGLKVSKYSLNISNNQTIKVTATITPTEAADKTVLWKSSNIKVATVDAKGNIKGKATGSATITATAKANGKISKKIAVKVSAKTVKVNRKSLSIIAGKTGMLSATVTPSDSTDKTVKWRSNNTKIATVDSKGKVTGKTKGTTTIIASVKGAKEVKIKVTVTSPIPAKSVKINKKSATLIKGKTLTLSATVSPSNTTNKTIKWKSSNANVAKVDSKGKVTAVGAGTAKITAKTVNGKTSSMAINVPYTKSLSAGTWKAGKHLPAGRYKITTNSGSGNLFIASGTDHFVNEILSSEDDGFGVMVVTTDIKSGDSVEILGLNSVQFTRVSHVKSNTLHAGYWTVGKDISPGRYKITTPKGSGNLIIYRQDNLLVNEILSSTSDNYTVRSVTATLKSGDKIEISSLNKVVFTKK
ncbi:Ig-like domain-containing protein [Niallia sp. NCCP-28]|uniref:Ig-like domain-containing protein n=1 Tax=Niallia sp. NCCP-28 TaxID=2934712 RepID=UPI0020862D76|nr:Ig-like domain-containing protein [Niallia sp. NCCP-28]GKU83830.1 hypothetical protein NCCP28_32260 [Niallia sp. NCCP-28]